LMPSKTSDDAANALRVAFVEMWKDPQFLAAYSNVIKTEPIMVTAQDGQRVLADLAKVPDGIKQYVTKYIADMTAK
jgi:hypothetical protein